MSLAHRYSILQNSQFVTTNDSTMFIGHGLIVPMNNKNYIYDELNGKYYMIPDGDIYYPTIGGKTVTPDTVNNEFFDNLTYYAMPYDISMIQVPGFALALPYEPKTIFFIYKTVNNNEANRPIMELFEGGVNGKITFIQSTEGGLHPELTIYNNSTIHTIGAGININDTNPHTISIEINRMNFVNGQNNFITRLIIDGNIIGTYDYMNDRQYMQIPKKISFGFTQSIIGANAYFSEIRIDSQNYSDEEILSWHYCKKPFIHNSSIVTVY